MLYKDSLRITLSDVRLTMTRVKTARCYPRVHAGPNKPLQKIRRMQLCTTFLIDKAPIQRLICEIEKSIRHDLRFRLHASLAL